MPQLDGSCFCGAVQYDLPDELEYAGYCHCSQCRKFSGSSYAVVGGIPGAKFKVISGEDRITYFQKSEETTVGFCSICGSNLFTRKKSNGMLNLRLGTLNQAPSLRPHMHIHVGSKAEWDEILDGLPQFMEGPV
ncbi:GFA family protein [Marinobacteraceae bacterium S3BR75-40.1]